MARDEYRRGGRDWDEGRWPRGGMSRGPDTEWGGGYAGGYGRQGGYGTRGGFGAETGPWQGEWSGEPGAYTGEAGYRRWMRGGGYGGLQGGGVGYAPDAWGGEIQGASYGRGWGAPGGRDVDLGPDRSADEQGRVNFAGRGPRGYRRSDVRISEEINEALTRHPDVDATDIEVRVENGEVTLTGVVEDKHAKRLAEDIAEASPGVTDVRNELRAGRARSADSGLESR